MASVPDVTVVHLPERSRSEIRVDGTCVGVAHYVRSGAVIDLEHVIVEPAFEGRGLGAELVAAVFAEARSSGDQIIPTCSFAAAWVRRHPDEADLLAG